MLPCWSGFGWWVRVVCPSGFAWWVRVVCPSGFDPVAPQNLGELPILEVYLARERARRGDGDEAIPLMRAAVDHLFREGQLLTWGAPATGVLVQTLLDRRAEGDVAEAEAAIEQLAAAPADEGLVVRDIWLLRPRALLTRARGDHVAYRDLVARYRAMAESLGFEGHIAWAEAMVDGRP